MKRYKVTQIMNTKQLGLMLVAGLLSFGASAQLDLNVVPPAKPATVMLASENVISAMGTAVSGTAYNVTGTAGFIIPTAETYYARIDLGGGATFTADPTSSFTLDDNNLMADDRASGGMGSSTVILSLSQDSVVAVDDVWTLNGVSYTLNSRNTVSFTYRLYESATDAIGGGDNHLSIQSENLIMFADATKMAGAATKTPEIDVETSSIKYVGGGSTTHVMKVDITDVIGDQRKATPSGDDLKLEDVVASITLTATGNFTAVAAAVEDGPAGKVWLDRDATCTPDIPAVVADPDAQPTAVIGVAAIPGGDNLGLAVVNEAGLEAVVTLTNAADAEFEDTTGWLCMQTNGVSEIPEGSYSGVLSMTAAMGYAAIADVGFDGSTLEKNSESAVLDFLLTPDGVFRNYVRLTNTSNVLGSNLTVTLINDAGDQVTFDLSDAGVSSDLAPRASTPLINIKVLYEAAQAVDRGMDADGDPVPMFTVEGDGMGDKLRAKFEGSVLEDSLEAQALSVSTDNTSFFTF